MVLGSNVIAFTLAASLLTITPGLDTALVLRTLAANGPNQALKAACGVGLGCLGWGLIVAAGLGALLVASHLAYEALRWIGAGYLFYLGGTLLLAPRRTGIIPEAMIHHRKNFMIHPFFRGFLTNILNPKVGIFYVSFLPQFIPTHANVPILIVVLASIHVVLGLAWFGVLITAARPLIQQLQRPKVIAMLDRLTGLVFIGFGAKLAFSARP